MPGMRERRTGFAERDRRRNGYREQGCKHGQPALFMLNQWHGNGATGESGHMRVTNTHQHVVPALRDDRKLFARELWRLSLKKMTNQTNGDRHLAGGSTHGSSTARS